MDNPLIKATDKETSWISLKGQKLDCKALRIPDGDTVHIAVQAFGGLYKIPCRMIGYDSPEIKSKTLESILARKQLIQECTSLGNDFAGVDTSLNTKLVQAEFHGKDKYGRELVKLYDQEGCINDRLMLLPYNVSYTGRGVKPYAAKNNSHV